MDALSAVAAALGGGTRTALARAGDHILDARRLLKSRIDPDQEVD
jgi:hypothetical protein